MIKKKRVKRGIVFFIGWILSPFTWWNDTFVNVPLSYLVANILHYIIHIKFIWLLMVSYWFTNFLGLYLMYYGGKRLIMSSKDKIKTAMLLIIFMVIYSLVMIYLNKQGKLMPLYEFFRKYC